MGIKVLQPDSLREPSGPSPQPRGARRPGEAAQRLDPPEIFCQEDDSSLQHCRGKYLKDLLKTETAQQRSKIHVF